MGIILLSFLLLSTSAFDIDKKNRLRAMVGEMVQVHDSVNDSVASNNLGQDILDYLDFPKSGIVSIRTAIEARKAALYKHSITSWYESAELKFATKAGSAKPTGYYFSAETLTYGRIRRQHKGGPTISSPSFTLHLCHARIDVVTNFYKTYSTALLAAKAKDDLPLISKIRKDAEEQKITEDCKEGYYHFEVFSDEAPASGTAKLTNLHQSGGTIMAEDTIPKDYRTPQTLIKELQRVYEDLINSLKDKEGKREFIMQIVKDYFSRGNEKKKDSSSAEAPNRCPGCVFA